MVFCKSTNGLKFLKGGKNPLTFFNEKCSARENLKKLFHSKVKLLKLDIEERRSFSSISCSRQRCSTFSLDSIAAVSQVDFKLKIENNLKMHLLQPNKSRINF
jgi:hypothetical protein